MDHDQSCSFPTQPVNDTLSAALHFLAGDVCLRVNDCGMDKCRPLIFPESHSKVCIDSLSTWLCDGAHIFTLFRPSDLMGTLIFSHTNEVLYHASIDAQLSKDCPVDVGFLCQFTFDSMPEGLVPRLLAFDVISSSRSPPAVRGDMLRGLQGHLPNPLCCVQWIGPRQYLSPQFIDGLPHKINGVVSLGEDPLAVLAWEV
jgi:hypothetical protein